MLLEREASALLLRHCVSLAWTCSQDIPISKCINVVFTDIHFPACVYVFTDIQSGLRTWKWRKNASECVLWPIRYIKKSSVCFPWVTLAGVLFNDLLPELEVRYGAWRARLQTPTYIMWSSVHRWRLLQTKHELDKHRRNFQSAQWARANEAPGFFSTLPTSRLDLHACLSSPDPCWQVW